MKARSKQSPNSTTGWERNTAKSVIPKGGIHSRPANYHSFC